MFGKKENLMVMFHPPSLPRTVNSWLLFQSSISSCSLICISQAHLEWKRFRFFYSYFLGLLLSEPSLSAVRKPVHPDSTWKGAHREEPHVSFVNELLEVGPLAPVEPPQLTPADVPTETCQIIDSWRKKFIGIVLSHSACLFVLSMIPSWLEVLGLIFLRK